MTGWHNQVGDEFVIPSGVIGIVVAKSFNAPEVIREKLEAGISRVSPNTVWVMRDAERKGHAAGFAWQTFKSHGIVPFLAPLTPGWKGEGYDLRANMRDIEMRTTCERVIVFHDKGSNVTANWIDYCIDRKESASDGSHCVAKIYVVERGKVKVKKYKQGKAMS